MGLLKSIGSVIRRRRAGKGFGIHSPFAFSFVTSVLNCPYDYYAFPHIVDEVSHFGGISRRGAKTLFRVLAHFNPRTVMISSDPTGVIHEIVRSYSSTVSIGDYSPEAVPQGGFIVVNGKGVSDALIRSAVEARCTFFFTSTDTPAWETAKSGMTAGMTFTNGTMGIAIPDPMLPRQDFVLKF